MLNHETTSCRDHTPRGLIPPTPPNLPGTIATWLEFFRVCGVNAGIKPADRLRLEDEALRQCRRLTGPTFPHRQ